MFYGGAAVGLHPVRNQINASPNWATRHFPISPDETSMIFCHSPVTLTGECDEHGQPYVRLAKPGERLIGSTVGFNWSDFRGRDFPHFKPGCECHVDLIVEQGPHVAFTMWVDTPTEADAAKLCGGKNFNFTAESAACGSSMSNVAIDLATISTDEPLTMKLLRRVRAPWGQIDASGCAGAKGEYWEVMINNHLHDSPTAGV